MSRAGRRRTTRADDGFTVIELAVAMVVFGVLVAISATGWGRYQANQAAVSASGEIVSVMRNAQMRATAEATTYRVDVDAAARTLTVFRYDGAAYVRRAASTLDGGALRLQDAGFKNKSGATTSSAFFYARGTASPGKVAVGLQDRPAVHTVTIEGLTGRVWTS